jgi:hypothetical protein
VHLEPGSQQVVDSLNVPVVAAATVEMMLVAALALVLRR